MPNWCENTVDFYFDTSDNPDRERVVQIFSSEKPFQAILPMPELLSNTASGGRRFQVDGQETYVTSWYRSSDAQGETIEERPFTDEEVQALREFGASDWYEWRNRHWGTKWDIDSQVPVDDGLDHLQYQFDTAWGPPEGIYRALRELLSESTDISWFYKEEGMRLAGWLN